MRYMKEKSESGGNHIIIKSDESNQMHPQLSKIYRFAKINSHSIFSYYRF